MYILCILCNTIYYYNTTSEIIFGVNGTTVYLIPFKTKFLEKEKKHLGFMKVDKVLFQTVMIYFLYHGKIILLKNTCPVVPLTLKIKNIRKGWKNTTENYFLVLFFSIEIRLWITMSWIIPRTQVFLRYNVVCMDIS